MHLRKTSTALTNKSKKKSEVIVMVNFLRFHNKNKEVVSSTTMPTDYIFV